MFTLGKKPQPEQGKHCPAEEYVEMRDTAIRSLNRKKIESWMVRLHERVPKDEWVLWASACKIGTAMEDIPISEWLMYATWLERNGSYPLCDRWEEGRAYLDGGGSIMEPPEGADIPFIAKKQEVLK